MISDTEETIIWLANHRGVPLAIRHGLSSGEYQWRELMEPNNIKSNIIWHSSKDMASCTRRIIAWADSVADSRLETERLS